jgi:hypothetical protein
MWAKVDMIDRVDVASSADEVPGVAGDERLCGDHDDVPGRHAGASPGRRLLIR